MKEVVRKEVLKFLKLEWFTKSLVVVGLV